MKIYRKDRLFASDKEKTECLQDVLKNVRITDENAFFAQTKAQDSPVSTPTNNNVQRNNVVGPRGGQGSSNTVGSGVKQADRPRGFSGQGNTSQQTNDPKMNTTYQNSRSHSTTQQQPAAIVKPSPGSAIHQKGFSPSHVPVVGEQGVSPQKLGKLRGLSPQQQQREKNF